MNLDFYFPCLDQLAQVLSKKYSPSGDYTKQYFTTIVVDILRESKKNFTSKVDLQTALLTYFQQKWLLESINQDKSKQQTNNQTCSQPSFMIDLKKNQEIVIHLNQIIVKFIIIGLNYSLRKQASLNLFKQLNLHFTELQMHLMLETTLSISSLLLEYIKKIIEFFPFLEFYEYLLKLFQVVDNYHLIEYFQDKIKQYREAWEKKNIPNKTSFVNATRVSEKNARDSVFMPKKVTTSSKKQIRKTPDKQQKNSNKKQQMRTQIKTSQVKMQQMSRKSLSRTLYHNTKMKYAGRKTQVFISKAKQSREVCYQNGQIKQQNGNNRQKRLLNSRLNMLQSQVTPSNFDEHEINVFAFGTPPKKSNKQAKNVQNTTKQLQM